MWYRRYALELDVAQKQAKDEGIDIPEALLAEIARVQALDPASEAAQNAAAAILDAIAALPVAPQWPYREPDELDEIRRERPTPTPLSPVKPDYDRIYGAWLGRTAGCLLGNPVEGWRRERLLGFLRDTGNLPIARYLSSDVGADIRARYDVDDRPFRIYNAGYLRWIDKTFGGLEDDDTNYTVLALQLLEDYGWDFTSEDVAMCWLSNLPPLCTHTAERNAVGALLLGIAPPDSARFRNPMREWIGAAIRADFYGYIAPGDPALAAEFAWRDARVSHAKNGVYGAMWVAAMHAAAALDGSMEQIVRLGLEQIPARCRLAECIGDVLAWREAGLSAEEALEAIHGRYSDADIHCAVHTLANEMIVAVALLWGEGLLGKSIGLAVQGAMDTDCNGATVGSIVGMARGAEALPREWIDPLHDRICTRVNAQGEVRLSSLAARTLRVASLRRSGRLAGVGG